MVFSVVFQKSDSPKNNSLLYRISVCSASAPAPVMSSALASVALPEWRLGWQLLRRRVLEVLGPGRSARRCSPLVGLRSKLVAYVAY